MKTGSKKERLLAESLLKGTTVGIKLRDSKDLVVLAVVNFVTDPDRKKCIVIKPHTLYGKPVPDSIIPLRRIERVVSYSVRYDDPLYVRLREIKAKILGIR